jgi:hypothetical protein
LGSLLKEAGFDDDQLNSLRSAYVDDNEAAFGSIIKAGPKVSGRKYPDSFPQADKERIDEVGRKQWAAEQNVARDEQVKADRTAAVKEENPMLSAMFPRTAEDIGSGEVGGIGSGKFEDMMSGEIQPGMEYQNPLNSISGGAVIDVGTLPGRAYVAATDMLPGGEGTFLESLAKTEADPDLPWLQRIPEQILRDDPTIAIPGAAAVKGAKALPRLGAAVGEQLFLEGGRQALDEELNVGNLMVAGGLPIATDAFAYGAKQFAKSGLESKVPGADAELLLEEGLVPVTGGVPGIQKRVADRSVEETEATIQQARGRTDEFNEGAAARESKIPEEMRRGNAIVAETGIPLPQRYDLSANLEGKYHKTGILTKKDIKEVDDIISSEYEDMFEVSSFGRDFDDVNKSDFLASPEVMSNKAARWYKKSGLVEGIPDNEVSVDQAAYRELWAGISDKLPQVSSKAKQIAEQDAIVSRVMANKSGEGVGFAKGVATSNPAIRTANALSRKNNIGRAMMATAKETEDELTK